MGGLLHLGHVQACVGFIEYLECVLGFLAWRAASLAEDIRRLDAQLESLHQARPWASAQLGSDSVAMDGG